jgi:uncharacterized membrane protein
MMIRKIVRQYIKLTLDQRAVLMAIITLGALSLIPFIPLISHMHVLLIVCMVAAISLTLCVSYIMDIVKEVNNE